MRTEKKNALNRLLLHAAKEIQLIMTKTVKN